MKLFKVKVTFDKVKSQALMEVQKNILTFSIWFSSFFFAIQGHSQSTLPTHMAKIKVV